jgi:cupin fold WbuC family metalloprotein
MKIIDDELLNAISKQAKDSPRLRQNYNFHELLNDNVQRLLNALEPGTKMPLHRHQNTDETYFLVRGSLKVLTYNDNKELVNSEILSIDNGKYGVQIQKGQWHSIEVLEENTVIFEVKEGPYCPLEADNILE